MVRKTKQEALVTRGRILDAAERLFHDKGVSRTSLQDIARAADVTRGAIYWHFRDKAELFDAMLQRVLLPMEDMKARLQDGGGAPLQTLREQLVAVLAGIAGDRRAQRVFSIATHKVEYVGELVAVRDRHVRSRRAFLALLEHSLRAAQEAGEVDPGVPAREAAVGLQALMAGLIHSWMLAPRSFDLRAAGTRAIDTHLAGLARRA